MAENARIEELRRRVESDPASIAFAALAEEYRRTGRHEDAIEICRTGLQRHPAYLSARVTLGRALIEAGDLDSARTELETVLKSAPENLAAIRGLAQIHDRQGHSTEMSPHLVALAATPFPVREPDPEPVEALPTAMPEPVAESEPDLAPAYAPASALEPTLSLVDPMPVEIPAPEPAVSDLSFADAMPEPMAEPAPDAARAYAAPSALEPELSLVDPSSVEIPAPEPAVPDVAFAATTEPPTIDLPQWPDSGSGITFDLPSEPATPETIHVEPIQVEVPMEAAAVAAPPTGVEESDLSSGVDGAVLGRLELFLGAVQHARAELPQSLSH